MHNDDILSFVSSAENNKSNLKHAQTVSTNYAVWLLNVETFQGQFACSQQQRALSS